MASSSPPADLCPACRAARALLAWSQQDLAKAAGVATSTVADFERVIGPPLPITPKPFAGALDGAGIAVPAHGRGHRAGRSDYHRVRSSRRRRSAGSSAEDLSNGRTVPTAPSVCRRSSLILIQANLAPPPDFAFPLTRPSASARDGRTTTETGSAYVPRGRRGLGNRRPAQDHRAEGERRLSQADGEPAPLDPPAPQTFSSPHATVREGPNWAKALQDQGPWREVRAYDANDLVHWIEQFPAVGLWLATRLASVRLVTRYVTRNHQRG